MAKAKEPVITVSTVFAGRQTDRQAFIDLIIQKRRLLNRNFPLTLFRQCGTMKSLQTAAYTAERRS